MTVYDLVRLMDATQYIWVVDDSDKSMLYFEGLKDDIPIALLKSRVNYINSIKIKGIMLGIEYQGE